MATIKPAKKPKSTSTKGHYITNAELLVAIAEAKELSAKKGVHPPVATDKLAKGLWMIAERYSFSPSFAGYSFREDMVAFAVVNLVANWYKFDPTKSDNPFAFYTTAAYRSFLQFLHEEKKQRNIRDELLIDAGANPSFSYQDRAKTASSDDTAFRSSSGDD